MTSPNIYGLSFFGKKLLTVGCSLLMLFVLIDSSKADQSQIVIELASASAYEPPPPTVAAPCFRNKHHRANSSSGSRLDQQSNCPTTSSSAD